MLTDLDLLERELARARERVATLRRHFFDGQITAARYQSAIRVEASRIDFIEKRLAEIMNPFGG